MKFKAELDKVYDLKTDLDGWPDSRHRFEQDHIHAIQAAIACRRPLLIRGEPGIGKSQLARAAASGRSGVTPIRMRRIRTASGTANSFRCVS